MPDLNKILSAAKPLTLAGVPTGFEPWLLADLARAAKTRAVFIAPDEAAMRAIAATATIFAPELEVLTFPAWDCLPYDRASPTLRVMAERMATLHRLQQPTKAPQLLVTTANAAAQRTLTPFRIRQLVATLAPKERIGRDKLAALLQANGYMRVETVADSGEFAVRGGLVDLFPSGEDQALRLDFFGDEIESVRTFDPSDQRTTGRIEGFTLLPASETLLDEDSIKRFRGRYRERFGATATGDPLYQAISEGRRLAGMEHWLPLFEEKMATLFDHLGDDAVVVRDAGVLGAAEQRFEAITDYHANRVKAQSSDPGSYRPLPPDALYLAATDFAERLEAAPAHLTTPFHEPESATVLDLNVDGPRDFGAERSSGANIYEAVVEHIAALKRDGRKPILASYSTGARERLAGLLKDHGAERLVMVDTWQEALGASSSPLPRAGGESVAQQPSSSSPSTTASPPRT
jgi:transcription-repair coupling factor (superfamily II helicase)